MTGLPKGLTASTGMDALSHAVEAYMVGKHNEYADMFCENCIRRVVKWLPVAVADGTNLEARGQMMLAANFGGASFASSTLQAGHAIAHGVGAALHSAAWHCLRVGPELCHQALRSHYRYGSSAEHGFLAGVDVAGKDRQELIDACCKVVKDMNDSLDVPYPQDLRLRIQGGYGEGLQCHLDQ